MGTLYLVATPIGNLDDLTPRALRVLAEAGAVAAEDTRTARALLAHFGLRARMLSYTEHNRRARIPRLLTLLDSQDVALISEAGTPAISDPGLELVAAATAAGYRVVAVPGASAILAALVVSGLSTRQFVFVGFLPRRRGERRAFLRELAQEPRTLVCFESPHRLRAALTDLLAVLGDRRVAICRELTKLHEETLRLRLSEALARQEEPRGEYTLVIEGAERAERTVLSSDLRIALLDLRRQGLGAREATTRLADEFRVPRRRLYEAWLALDDEPYPETPMLD